MSPEILGAGFVFFQRLVLCGREASRADGDNCCERKNRSIESRFHRVSPYAAGPAAMLFLLCPCGRSLREAQNPTTSSAREKRSRTHRLCAFEMNFPHGA